MVGKNQIQIDSRQFLQGLATSDYMPDGGIGTSSHNITPVATPGVIRATASAAPVGGDTPLMQLIASCEDPRTAPSGTVVHVVMVADDGKLYTSDDNNLTLRHTPSSSSSYTPEQTDMIAFDGRAYVTRVSDVARVTIPNTISDAWTVDETWWTVTKSETLTGGTTVHPMLVYESFMWVADAANLHKVDASENITRNVLQLGDSEKITALGVDPATGLMMIASSTVRTNDSYPARSSFVYLFDGYSSKARRRIPIDAQIVSFRNVGGAVYVFTDNTVGLWNGTGITFLRKLTNVSDSSDTAPYKLKTTRSGNTLYVVDGIDLLAYGEVTPGKKVWYPVYRNQTSSGVLNFVCSAGADDNSSISYSPHIIVNHDTTTVRYLKPLNTTTASTGTLRTPRIYFERPVNIRRVRIFTTGITTTAGIGGVSILDEDGTTTTPTVSGFVVASGTKYRFDFDFNKGLQELQVNINFATQAFGVSRVVVYYDVIE